MENQYTPEQVKEFLEAQVLQSRGELKESLKNLGHSQKERIILAIAEYPQAEEDFTADGEEMVKAFSALKRCFDTNVAFGVETVLQEMQQEMVEKMSQNEENTTKEENNG